MAIATSGVDVPSPTSVSPTKPSARPSRPARCVAEPTSTSAPRAMNASPPTTRVTVSPVAAFGRSKKSEPSDFSSSGGPLWRPPEVRAGTRIARPATKITPFNRDSPPVSKMAKRTTAAVLMGASRRTVRESTRTGATRAAIPRARETLTTFEPTRLPTASCGSPRADATPATRSSGTLAPSPPIRDPTTEGRTRRDVASPSTPSTNCTPAARSSTRLAPSPSTSAITARPRPGRRFGDGVGVREADPHPNQGTARLGHLDLEVFDQAPDEGERQSPFECELLGVEFGVALEQGWIQPLARVLHLDHEPAAGDARPHPDRLLVRRGVDGHRAGARLR